MSIFKKTETKIQTRSPLRALSTTETQSVGGGTQGTVEHATGAGNATGHVGGGVCGRVSMM